MNRLLAKALLCEGVLGAPPSIFPLGRFALEGGAHFFNVTYLPNLGVAIILILVCSIPNFHFMQRVKGRQHQYDCSTGSTRHRLGDLKCQHKYYVGMGAGGSQTNHSLATPSALLLIQHILSMLYKAGCRIFK